MDARERQARPGNRRKAILQHKHPKNGKPLVRIQSLQKELTQAIAHDVSLAVRVAEGEHHALDEGIAVGGADSSASVGCAAVGSPNLPAAGNSYVDSSLEPDPDLLCSGFGWDDPDNF